MKILFCIKAMNNPGGGAERVLATVANGLVDRDHEVAVLTFEQPGGNAFYPLHPSIKRIDLGIGSTVRPATLGETLNRIPALRRAILRCSPDVVIGFMHSMFVPLGLSMLGNSIPIIASEHIVPEHYRSRRLIETGLLSITPLLVRQITCVSEQVRLSYPFYLRKSMVAIANPVAMSSSHSPSPQRRKLGRILLSVGRLEPQKDHATLIQAFGQIAEEFPEWTLKIIGDGGLREKLESQIQTLGLRDRICLPGSTQNIAAEYQSADLFVIPSKYESFGLTVVEALSYGLPVVGFQSCQGVNQLVQSGVNGLLIDTMDNRMTALTNSLKRIMSNKSLLHNLSNGTTQSLEPHRINNVLDCWEALLRKILPKP